MRLLGESVKTPAFSVVLLVLSLGCIPLVCASSSFHITVGTDKSSYAQYENVRVSGTVTLEETPLRALLVALEVRDEQGAIVAVGTSQTDEEGFFMFAFRLSPIGDSQNHTAYVSAQWGSHLAMSYVAFLLEALESTQCDVDSDEQAIVGSVVVIFLLALLGALLSSVSALFVFYFLKPAETEPSIRSETRIQRTYRTCVNCGNESPKGHTFCRYCLTYLG